MRRKIIRNRTRKLIAIKKSLFIPIRLHSVTISGYILKAHSTRSSLKKKKKEKERMRRGRKEEREEKEKKGEEEEEE